MEENKKSYFGEIGSAMKTLAIGMKTTWKELLTKKSTEQYPENRKTTLHVAARHRGRLVMNRDENGAVYSLYTRREGLPERHYQDCVADG